MDVTFGEVLFLAAHFIGLAFPVVCCWLLYRMKKEIWKMRVKIEVFGWFYENELGTVAKAKFIEALHEQWEEEERERNKQLL